MPKTKAILFDLDGTLIDSEAAILGAFKHVLDTHGQVYDEAVVKSYVGRVLEHTYKSLAPDNDTHELMVLHRTWQMDNKHLLKGFDGLSQFLDVLKKQNLKLGIYTSGYRLRTDMILDMIGIREYFDEVICGEEVTHPKPHEEGILTLAKKMNVKPSEVIMVGDAEHDILSGKNAGVVTVGITHGFGTKEALKKAGADYIVDSLTELDSTIATIEQNKNPKYV